MQLKKDVFMKAIFFATALTSVIAVALICLFLFISGVPAICKIGFINFLFGKEWSPSDTPPVFGILPMIVGSFYITAGAIIVGVPIGIFSAVYMARICPIKLYRIIKPGIDLLAGIPSVVYGFFGITIIVPMVRKWFGGTGTSALAASILLGMMILPTVVSLSESAIRALPGTYLEGALALGASKWRSIFTVELPAAKSGIFASIVLGIGRAIGETMAVVMVEGNQARMPKSLLAGVRTLTANIVIEMGYAAQLHREALIATGVVLFVFILIINFSFSLLKRRSI